MMLDVRIQPESCGENGGTDDEGQTDDDRIGDHEEGQQVALVHAPALNRRVVPGPFGISEIRIDARTIFVHLEFCSYRFQIVTWLKLHITF